MIYTEMNGSLGDVPLPYVYLPLKIVAPKKKFKFSQKLYKPIVKQKSVIEIDLTSPIETVMTQTNNLMTLSGEDGAGVNDE